jgi:hypothetical protein
MSKLFLAALVLALSAIELQAQNSTTHQHEQADMIDGSAHPELIPDAVAYRLYFVVISENPTPLPNESRRQHAHLQRAGLKENDIRAAATVLANFKVQYALLLDQYSKSPEVLRNSSDGLPLFIVKRDAIVQATRDALKSALTPSGMASFDTHIQREKTMMKVAATEVQP